MRSLPQSLFVLILLGGPLSAELLHVELTIGGLDCLSCAESVGKVLKKIKGVDTAEFRTQGSVAVMDLKAGNTIQIEQIRDAMKGIGYTPKAARLTVRGEARNAGTKWMLLVTGSAAEYELDVSGVRAVEGSVLVEGSIAEPGAALKVSAMRRE